MLEMLRSATKDCVKDLLAARTGRAGASGGYPFASRSSALANGGLRLKTEAEALEKRTFLVLSTGGRHQRTGNGYAAPLGRPGIVYGSKRSYSFFTTA